MKPTFVFSKSKALAQFNTLLPLADIISYSSKTNPLVTPLLEKETQAMFSIHMLEELQHVKDKSRVLFLAQAWSEQIILSLFDQGIRWFVVDNVADLDTFLYVVEKNDLKELHLLLRLKLKENTLKTEKYYVFGMPSTVINKRIREIVAKPLLHQRFSSLGIHFHRKTQNMCEWNYAYELKHLLDEDTFKAITYVNMGGGLPAVYANTNVKVLQGIFSKIQETREVLAQHNIKLMLEPGRFIAAPSIELHTTIIGKHENTLIVNASVYNTDMDALIVPVKLLVKGELQRGEADPYVIKGITPCSLDLFRYRVYLKNPQVGDTIVFLNAGAYNFHTQFCDLTKVATEVIE